MIGKGRHRMFPLSKWKKYQLRRRKRKELSVEWIWWCGNTHSDFSTVANASDYFTSLFSQLFRPMIILKLVRLFSGLSLASECFLGRKAKEGLSRGDLSGSASTSSVNSLRARAAAAAAVRRRKKKILETLRCCFHPWNRGLFRPLPFPAPSSRRLTTAHLEFPLTGPLSLLISFFLSLMPLFGQRALFSQDRFPFLFFMFLSELLLPSIQTRNNRSFCFASAPRGSGMLLGVHITRDLYCGSGFQFPTLLATTTAATLNSRHETKIVSIKGGKGTKKLK